LLQISRVQSDPQLNHIRILFSEYASSLGFDLSFQDFRKELERLPGDYCPPDGCLLIASDHGSIAGCCALRRLSIDTCEMKRLYVRPESRGRGIGKALAERVIQEARRMGYHKMRLDTVPSMTRAVALYRKLGFKEIEPYRFNPVPGALFMELLFE
jgi:putative acetyltransferase